MTVTFGSELWEFIRFAHLSYERIVNGILYLGINLLKDSCRDDEATRGVDGWIVMWSMRESMRRVRRSGVRRGEEIYDGGRGFGGAGIEVT